MSIAHATADEHRFLRVSLAAPPDPRWAEDMTNELNYIPQNRDGILRELLLSLSLSLFLCVRVCACVGTGREFARNEVIGESRPFFPLLADGRSPTLDTLYF